MAQEELARLEASDQVFYVLVKHLHRNLEGFEFTVSNGLQAWKTSGKNELACNILQGVRRALVTFCSKITSINPSIRLSAVSL